MQLLNQSRKGGIFESVGLRASRDARTKQPQTVLHQET